MARCVSRVSHFENDLLPLCGKHFPPFPSYSYLKTLFRMSERFLLSFVRNEWRALFLSFVCAAVGSSETKEAYNNVQESY